MTASGWLQIIITLAAIFLLSIPTGRYMARINMGQKTRFDRFFDPIDNAIYFLIGRKVTSQAMNWKVYAFHMLATNMAMALIIYAVYVLQDHLPLNQLGFSAELCLNLGDGVNQAANLASSTTSIPSRNLAPLTTFGNWF
jgi:K+-transporting ATPase A subunit